MDTRPNLTAPAARTHLYLGTAGRPSIAYLRLAAWAAVVTVISAGTARVAGTALLSIPAYLREGFVPLSEPAVFGMAVAIGVAGAGLAAAVAASSDPVRQYLRATALVLGLAFTAGAALAVTGAVTGGTAMTWLLAGALVATAAVSVSAVVLVDLAVAVSATGRQR